MTEKELAALIRGIAPVIKKWVAVQAARIDTLESRVLELEGRDGARTVDHAGR